MTLFAGMSIFVLARSLMPGLGKMLVAAPAASAMRDENALPGFGKVCEGFAGIPIKDQRADGNLQNHVFAGMARAVGAFAVAAAFGFEFAVVAIAQEGIVVRIGFNIDAAAMTAVAARGSPARNEFFTAKRDTAIAAVAGLYENFSFVNEQGE